jgi:glucokinase
MALRQPYQAEYRQCGCFEYYASGTGLARNASKLMTTQTAFAAFDRGDPIAKAIIKDAIQFWGMAVANLVSIFNPQRIILGGGVFGPAKKFIPAIYAEARKWAQPIAIKQVKLCASRLGPDAGLIGAAFLALHATRNSS